CQKPIEIVDLIVDRKQIPVFHTLRNLPVDLEHILGQNVEQLFIGHFSSSKFFLFLDSLHQSFLSQFVPAVVPNQTLPLSFCRLIKSQGLECNSLDNMSSVIGVYRWGNASVFFARESCYFKLGGIFPCFEFPEVSVLPTIVIILAILQSQFSKICSFFQ